MVPPGLAPPAALATELPRRGARLQQPSRRVVRLKTAVQEGGPPSSAIHEGGPPSAAPQDGGPRDPPAAAGEGDEFVSQMGSRSRSQGQRS